MGRLSRAELQQRNRLKVLTAARAEFAEHGFAAATIDGIAERAELTRGAVYSNFSGKRALYLSVLADLAEQPPLIPVEAGTTRPEALSAFATAWLNRVADDSMVGRLPAELAEDCGPQYAQLLKLDAILLGLALENLPTEIRLLDGLLDRPLDRPVDRLRRAGGRRQVRVAETALTTLYGAGQLAASAPGFIQPFAIASACGQLATVDLGDRWEPPPSSPPLRPADEPWAPPIAIDALRGTQARLDQDGVVLVLGLNRLAAAEDAVRVLPPGTAVTIVLVSSQPTELGPLARLIVAEPVGCLRQAFPEYAWPAVQVVHDEAVAAAAGVEEVGSGLEFAVRVSRGRIVARAEGFGATYAVASADVVTQPSRSDQTDPESQYAGRE